MCITEHEVSACMHLELSKWQCCGASHAAANTVSGIFEFDVGHALAGGARSSAGPVLHMGLDGSPLQQWLHFSSLHDLEIPA